MHAARDSYGYSTKMPRAGAASAESCVSSLSFPRILEKKCMTAGYTTRRYEAKRGGDARLDGKTVRRENRKGKRAQTKLIIRDCALLSVNTADIG
jgi:hypothetical protein